MSAFGSGPSNGNFWYGNRTNFPGFLYKKMWVSAVDAALKWHPEAISHATALPIYTTSISPDREV